MVNSDNDFKAREESLKLIANIRQYICPPQWTSRARIKVKELMKLTKMRHAGWQKLMADYVKSYPFNRKSFPYLSTKTATIFYNLEKKVKLTRKYLSLIDFHDFREYDKTIVTFKEYARDTAKQTRNPLFEKVWSNSYNCLSSLGDYPRLRRRLRKHNGDSENDFPINEDLDIEEYESEHSSDVEDDYSDVDEKVFFQTYDLYSVLISFVSKKRKRKL